MAKNSDPGSTRRLFVVTEETVTSGPWSVPPTSRAIWESLRFLTARERTRHRFGRFSTWANRGPTRAVWWVAEMTIADRIESTDNPSADLLAGSLADLRDDFEELADLSWSMRHRVDGVRREIRTAASSFHRVTARALLDDLTRMARRLDEFRYAALVAGRDATHPDALEPATRRKAALAELLRTLITQAATLVVAGDWQSPSFAHAVHSSAGRHDGRITEHQDDYKRDRHPDAVLFERAYLSEYVARPEGLRALMTNCGMAAFATILSFLETDRRIDGPVVVGRATYHECLDLLARSRFGERLVLVDEADTDRLVEVLDRRRPGAVFLDSLCNARGVAVPDLAEVIDALVARPGPPTYLVVDNTGRSCSFDPLGLVPPAALHVRVLAFESLTKYPQLGLDRATAGMIVAGTADGEDLDARREHLGTNVTDTSVHVIPWPDRSRLERRLARLGRNAGAIAARLQAYAESRPRSPLRSAVHPSLPCHPSFPLAAPFLGGFLSLDFEPALERDEIRSAFVRLSLNEASRRRVPLAAGASFGLNTTRVYVTASNSNPAPGFVRISPGTEHVVQVEALAGVFETALDRLPHSGISP